MENIDSAILKRSVVWTSIQAIMLGLSSDIPLSGTAGANVPYFCIGDGGFALNANILPFFGGSNLSDKKKYTTIACAQHEGMRNVLLEF
jgi:hypothetical protein